MSVELVRAYLAPFGLEERIREFAVSSATVDLAAVAVGVEGARIAKSMGLRQGEEAIVLVVAGDQKIDNARYKAEFHTKARMLSHEETTALTGHAPGGVCPFALPQGVATYLDVSLRRFATVFPAAGSGNSAVEMSCEELERCASHFVRWVDVCRAKEA